MHRRELQNRFCLIAKTVSLRYIIWAWTTVDMGVARVVAQHADTWNAMLIAHSSHDVIPSGIGLTSNELVRTKLREFTTKPNPIGRCWVRLKMHELLHPSQASRSFRGVSSFSRLSTAFFVIKGGEIHYFKSRFFERKLWTLIHKLCSCGEQTDRHPRLLFHRLMMSSVLNISFSPVIYDHGWYSKVWSRLGQHLTF